MNRSRMLVAVSSPWASEKFLEPIADLARRLEAEVFITHVTQQKQEDEHATDAHQRGEETLRVLTDHLREAGLRAESLLLFSDDVPQAIVNTAKARGCTLIILGASTQGRLKRLLRGDVPSRLLRQSEIPVLVCPPDWQGHL